MVTIKDIAKKLNLGAHYSLYMYGLCSKCDRANKRKKKNNNHKKEK